MRRLLVIATVYYLIFGYAQLAAAWIVWPMWRPGASGLLVLLVGPAAGWLVHQAWRNAWTRWLQRAAYLWMGLGFLLLCVVVPIHLLRLLGLPGGGAALLLAAVYAPLAVWSIVNAHRIGVRRVALHSAKLDHPVRLVQVSDIHVGSRGPGFLPRVVRRVNALEPDAVLVTGDLIDLMQLPADALDSMGALAAPAFFAIGNHERYIGSDTVCTRLEALGVTVLRDAQASRGSIRVIGIDDAEARDQVPRTLDRMDSGVTEQARFSILMYHRPDGAEDAARAGVDLMLCGHTHNGQIVPFDRIVKRHFPRIAGRFDIDGMVLYVSPGTGTWGPTMRLGSSNEITVFDLSPPPSTASTRHAVARGVTRPRLPCVPETAAGISSRLPAARTGDTMATNGTSPPLQARIEGGGTPELSDWYLRSETGTLRDVLLGPAESFRWLGLENAAWSSLVRDTLRRGLRFDKQLAMRQHREMVDAYEQAGVTCHYLPVDEGVPYQVYARDSSFMTPYGAVICQLANPRRRGEYATVLRFYLEHDIPVYDMVSAGNFEGGDFNIIHHGAALIGYTDHRSERVAAEQVADWFRKEGWEIKYAPIDAFYVHIDLMVCMLNERCAAVCLDTTPDDIVEWLRGRGIEILPATFRETMALGCNVVALGQDRVLSTLGAPDLNAKMRAAGFTVYDPDMTMYTWAGGGVHCMCQPLRREAA